MRKPLAALVIAAATLAALAAPAAAAVPTKPADQTLPCNDGTGKSAQVWMTKYFAAKNPCQSLWLMIGWNCGACGASTDHSVWVAPGAHFNKGSVAAGTWNDSFWAADLRPTLDNCWPEGSQPVVYRGHHGKFETGGPAC